MRGLPCIRDTRVTVSAVLGQLGLRARPSAGAVGIDAGPMPYVVPYILSERCETRRLLSSDARHFRAVAPLQGGSFELLPADS